MIPAALVLLANLGLPRRPAGMAAAHSEPALPDSRTATRQLSALISGPVTDRDLPAVRRVHQAASGAAAALLAGAPVDGPAISALARGSAARLELTAAADGALRQHLAWEDPSISAYLARRLIGELATLDPQRLRRCARPECDLLFYDTTRSRTQRWHAEDTCGWRERQHQRRAGHAQVPPARQPGGRPVPIITPVVVITECASSSAPNTAPSPDSLRPVPSTGG